MMKPRLFSSAREEAWKIVTEPEAGGGSPDSPYAPRRRKVSHQDGQKSWSEIVYVA